MKATLILALVSCLAVLAAIPLLALALPSAGGWPGRWKMIACLLLAGSRLLLHAAGAAISLGTRSAVWNRLPSVMNCLSLLLQLALLICAAIYLAMVAARLQRRALGVLAACALAPCVLFTLASLAYAVTLMLELNVDFMTNITFAKIYSTCLALNLIWHALVWLGVALLAGVLALQVVPTPPK